MKNTLKGYLLGILTMAVLTGGIAYAQSNLTTLYDVMNEGVKIVVDGKELIPTDVTGKRVEPLIYQGTTYLPVRAVSTALNKAVYWDGPNCTVYLGEMDGKLEYPTVTINDVDNIGYRYSYFDKVGQNALKDNYGNTYSYANYGDIPCTFQTLLNMKYSRFKCTLYVPKGCTSDKTTKILIKADGKIIYTSPEITKTSAPIPININIKGCNDFQIEFADGCNSLGYIANAGFYQ